MKNTSEAQHFADGLVRLMKEYATKFDARINEVRAARESYRVKKVMYFGSGDFQAQLQRISHLRDAIHTITREASQLAEQGDVTDLTKVELRLRLAEVEGLLSACFTLIHAAD